jgi:hypothetical protein
MIRLTFLLVLTSLLSLQGFAQIDTERGHCGTHDEPLDRLKANIAYAKANPLQSRMTTWIPIRFHLIGETDGTNAVSTNNVLDMITSINVDFAPHNMQFFLDDTGGDVFDFTFSDQLYNETQNFQNFRISQKASNAITVYIPNNATPPGGTGNGVTLGYYSPRGDFLVFKKSEVNSNSATASHEIGHYLSLPHPFRGWDCATWTNTTNDEGFVTSPVTNTIANFCGFSAQIELVSRGSDGNCATAGDLFCDTQADYGVGFGWRNCNYTGGVQDATGTPLDPDENNFMGYFIGCNPYEFTPEQVGAMNADYLSVRRSFLRQTSPTSTEPVTERVSVISPADGGTTPFSNQATIDWEPVPNAEFYFVEVGDRRSLQSNNLIFDDVVASTSLTLNDLEGGEEYYYRIRPFSQASFGDRGSTMSFITGSVSGVSSQPEAVTSMTLFPNPTSIGGASTLKIDAAESGEITIVVRDLTGRVLATTKERVITGDNVIDMRNSVPSVKGTYTLSVSNAKGLSSKRFSVF